MIAVDETTLVEVSRGTCEVVSGGETVTYFAAQSSHEYLDVARLDFQASNIGSSFVTEFRFDLP